jgi:hypothetical protein
MDLHRLFTAFGLRLWNAGPRKSTKRQRRLLVEGLEDRALMAVADLVAYRPVTEHINYALHAVPASMEDLATSGPGIRVNGDDDNGNSIPDSFDGASGSTENDLIRVDAIGTGTSFVLSWDSQSPLAVWTTSTKAAPVSNGGTIVPGQPLWVEYVGASDLSPLTASLTLAASDATGSASDSVLFHRFQSVVIAIGGNTQDPRNFGDSRLGAFTMGGTLYDRGYDVHLYAHDQVQSSGQGAAYNEVKNAVLNRNVDYVAIFGYSWGGGATYELSVGLKNTPVLAGKYQLTYTAYVDGIRHGSISAETRLPAGTQWHDNFYQRKDWLLRGNSVAGAKNNVNVTLTAWGKSLVHTTIDDHATLQSILVNNLMTRVVV